MATLFHHDVVVATLASGSRGNCTYIGDEHSGVLVDCGVSTKQILDRMVEVGLGSARIDAVLITHEHADHVGAARVLDRRLFKETGTRVPFYMTRGTRIGLHQNCIPTRVERVQAGTPFSVGTRRIEPWTVPHDTSDPVAYTVEIGQVRAGVVTDLGRSTHLVERNLASLDIAVVEFNHDVQMLVEGEYPWRLKQRVRGPHGHLSNDQAAALVRAGASKRLRHLVLAHLSQDNNTPDLALEAAQRGLHDARCRGVGVHVAQQQIPLRPLRIEPPADFRPRHPRRRRPAARHIHDDDASRQTSLFG